MHGIASAMDETGGASGNSGSFRAFIAVEIQRREPFLPPIKRLGEANADIKVVSPDNLHVTLKFLGDTEERLIPEISKIMARCVSGIKPFDIEFRGLGAFPSVSRISVVWVGMQNAEILSEISQRLDDSLAILGFAREKRTFSPHLTLARVRSPRGIGEIQRIITEEKSTDYGKLTVDSIHLKKSVLTPQGPVYSTVETVRFG
jgi:2'-5' RNA ligase